MMGRQLKLAATARLLHIARRSLAPRRSKNARQRVRQRLLRSQRGIGAALSFGARQFRATRLKTNPGAGAAPDRAASQHRATALEGFSVASEASPLKVAARHRRRALARRAAALRHTSEDEPRRRRCAWPRRVAKGRLAVRKFLSDTIAPRATQWGQSPATRAAPGRATLFARRLLTRPCEGGGASAWP